MSLDTDQKLAKLLEKHGKYRADFQDTVKGWEKSLKKAVAVKSFGESDIIKTVRKALAVEIKEINDVLLYAPVVSERERERMLDKRGMYLKFLNLFRSAELTIENIDQALNYELGLDVPNKNSEEIVTE